VYSQGELATWYPDGVRVPTDPHSQYHPHRRAGEHTHYGDQTRWLAESIQRAGSFVGDAWRKDWLVGMAGYDGYIDGSMSETVAQAGETPSASNDIAGAARMAPILDLSLSLDDTLQAVREQTGLTHGDPLVVDAAEFFVRAIFLIQKGKGFAEAFRLAAAAGDYESLAASVEVARAEGASTANPLAAVKAFGLTCHTPEAFPAIVYLALLHEGNVAEALSINGLCGGDTAARAMVLAVLFAARECTVEASAQTIEEGK